MSITKYIRQCTYREQINGGSDVGKIKVAYTYIHRPQVIIRKRSHKELVGKDMDLAHNIVCLHRTKEENNTTTINNNSNRLERAKQR